MAWDLSSQVEGLRLYRRCRKPRTECICPAPRALWSDTVTSHNHVPKQHCTVANTNTPVGKKPKMNEDLCCKSRMSTQPLSGLARFTSTSQPCYCAYKAPGVKSSYPIWAQQTHTRTTGYMQNAPSKDSRTLDQSQQSSIYTTLSSRLFKQARLLPQRSRLPHEQVHLGQQALLIFQRKQTEVLAGVVHSLPSKQGLTYCWKPNSLVCTAARTPTLQDKAIGRENAILLLAAFKTTTASAQQMSMSHASLSTLMSGVLLVSSPS